MTSRGLAYVGARLQRQSDNRAGLFCLRTPQPRGTSSLSADKNFENCCSVRTAVLLCEEHNG